MATEHKADIRYITVTTSDGESLEYRGTRYEIIDKWVKVIGYERHSWNDCTTYDVIALFNADFVKSVHVSQEAKRMTYEEYVRKIAE